MNRSMNTKTILPLLALAAMTTASQAALIAGDSLLVDFGKDTGETVGNWNNVSLPASPNNLFATTTPTLVADLVRFSDNAATGVSLTSSASATGNLGIGGLDVTPVTKSFSGSGAIATTAQADVLFVNSSTVALTFANLDNSLTYNLEIMSLVPTARNANDITVNGTTISIDPNDSTAIYAFNGISVNGSDEIVISFDAGSSANVQHINAIELTAVPEPSSTALLGLGGLALILRRRR